MKWLRRLIRGLLGIDEALEKLDSIDGKLERLEKCIESRSEGYGRTPYVRTRNWNY